MAAATSAALLLGACAGAGPLGESGLPSTAYISVRNHNWMDITVYALTAGTRLRLGTVTSLSEERFRLTPDMVYAPEGLYLQADPIGSPAVYTSARILIQPGQTVRWDLENNLALSSYQVR